MKSTKDILTELGACAEAVKWAGRKTPKKAWETCKRGDWLLWIADKLNVGRKLLVLAACACARTALKYVPAGEERPRLAIEAAERWADNPTEKNKAAAWAAGDAAWAAAHKDMAKIVRKIIPFSVICKAIAGYEGKT